VEPDVEMARCVLIEKAPFFIKLLPRNTGWWYKDMNGIILEVEVGGHNILKKRQGHYTEHLRNGFFVIVSGKFIGMLVAKIDSIRLK